MKAQRVYQIEGAQLFIRDVEGATNANGLHSYLVCGLVVTNHPLETEAVHTISVNTPTYGESVVSEYQVETEQELIDKGLTDGFTGKGLDNIMQENIWRLKI